MSMFTHFIRLCWTNKIERIKFSWKQQIEPDPFWYAAKHFIDEMILENVNNNAIDSTIVLSKYDL